MSLAAFTTVLGLLGLVALAIGYLIANEEVRPTIVVLKVILLAVFAAAIVVFVKSERPFS